MKTLSLIIFCLLLNSLQLKAQSQDLLDNTWYLEKVVIDDSDIFVPNIGTPPIAYADFNSDFLVTAYCNELFANIEYLETLSFSLSGQGITFEGCGVEEYDVFDKIYYEEFFGSIDEFFQPFAFEITEESTSLKKLTITNTNGDQAVYYSETLSTNDVNGFGSVKLYPNPARNEFSIESDLALEQIKVYDELGQVVAKFKVLNSRSSYDISFLSSGTYFIELSSALKKKSVKKLVKQ